MQGEAGNPMGLHIVPAGLDETGSGGLIVAPRRPLLRGWSHAVAAVVAAWCAGVLWQLADGDRVKQVALLVYGLTNVLLYGISALYHITPWAVRRHALFRRLDHATIFAMIAGCYTPIAVVMLSGWSRPILLAAVWTMTVGCMLCVTLPRPVPRRVRVVLYFVLGFGAALISPTVVLTLGTRGVTLPAATGLLAIAGGLIYGFRRPALWPRIFGYHELFHLVSIAASSAFFLFVLTYVVPYARRG